MDGYKKILNNVKCICTKNKKILEYKKRMGFSYNIFDVLNIETKEVQLHSKFLASLFDPFGNHGKRGKFLEIFLKIVNFTVIDSNDCDVTREVFMGPCGVDYTQGGYIDILIKSKNGKYAIAIENKIYGFDQNNQLFRYKEYLENSLHIEKGNYKIFYLTLGGIEPSEKSVGNSEGKEKFWEVISYKSDIKRFIVEAIKITPCNPLIRETLVQYRNTVLKITHQDMESEMNFELINLLMDNGNIQYANEIANVLSKTKDEIFERNIIPELKKIKVNDIYFDRINDGNGVYELNKKQSDFSYTSDRWKEFNISVGFSFEKENYTDFFFGIKKRDECSEIPDDLIKKIKKIENNWNEQDSYWLWSAYIDDIPKQCQLSIKYFANPKKFIKKINETLKEISHKIENILNNL